MFFECECHVLYNLPTERDNHTTYTFLGQDIQHRLLGHLVKVQSITLVIIGRDRLRVVVDHNDLITQPS